MFFADTGTPCIWLAGNIGGGAGRRFHGSFTWASMAIAAPNALGAQLAYPRRQTIALCGDGGFTMLGLGDLLTQVERKARVVHIISIMHRSTSSASSSRRRGWCPSAWISRTPNFATLTRSYPRGGEFAWRNLLTWSPEALAYTDGPVVVDAVVDPC